ncbi:MAG: membrane protein insertase YidC [Deltaproteobacteria bacterium]|nr:membrane protein insertase YidC [Deltaproteobacteria bacterium]
MEHLRLFIAIGLSLLVFIVWNFFFVDEKKDTLPQQTMKTEQQAKKVPEVQEKPATVTAPSLKDTPSEQIKPSRTITVNGPLYTVKISEKGAVFKSFVLKNYKETINVDSPLLDMISPDLAGGTVRVGFADNSLQGFNGAVFSANLERDTVDIKNEPQEISFSWTSPLKHI